MSLDFLSARLPTASTLPLKLGKLGITRWQLTDQLNVPYVQHIVLARLSEATHPDLQRTTACVRHYAPSVFDEPAVGHCEMGEAWQDMIAI